MTKTPPRPRKSVVAEAPAPAVTDAATGAIAGISTPQLDIEKPAGTLDTTPPAAAPEAPAEPLTKPDGGGSYVRDPATGHLTRQEA